MCASEGMFDDPLNDCASLVDRDDDMWVCLVCGFVGCGASRTNHIEAHYNSQLHAYAMNTVTKRVWNFAGDPDPCV